MKILSYFPLFAFVLMGYLILVFSGFFPDNISVIVMGDSNLLTLPSGIIWRPTWGDLFLMLGIIVLFVELFKSTRTSTVSIIDHILSTFVLLAYLIIWLTSEWAGNSVFLILTMMTFLDVLAGFTITISAAKRDIGLGS
ncbi:MAG: hypothetical protein KAH22_10625 [Thiotrichaceae bacterium]|nr:hypothetical protein [Thiotrichaceae bacterium]